MPRGISEDMGGARILPTRAHGTRRGPEPGAQQQELAAAATRLIQTHCPSDYLTTRERECTAARRVATFGVFGPPDTVACVTDGQPASIHEITTATGVAAALADTLTAEGICAEVTPHLAEGYAGMLTPTPA